MKTAEWVNGSLEYFSPTNGAAARAEIEASVTIGDLVEAVGSVAEGATELITVVAHLFETRRAMWAVPTSAGERVVVGAPCSTRRLIAVTNRHNRDKRVAG